MSGPPEDDRRRTVAALLERHRTLLVRWMERRASGLLRFEGAEDLAQGVAMKALQVADRYEHRSEDEFVGWILAVARQHVADRHAWWRALKRDAGPAIRLTSAAGTTGSGEGAASEPVVARTGPATFAGRREMIDQATRALAALGDRDADLVRQQVAGVTVEETAARLGVSYEAAQRARLRAVDRLRKAYLLAGGPPRGGA